MSHTTSLQNRVKAHRMARGWSQAELARRAGISRAAVSAIEIERLVPSVAAALALAGALDCRVEELFAAGPDTELEPAWAWRAESEPARYWHAEVAGRTILYPVEATALGVIGHDGICDHGLLRERSANRPDQTLVMASCDPAAALVATELARATPFRLLVLPRSSTQALELLGRGLVHLAGVHLAKAGQRGGNAAVVRRTLGPGYTLVRVARWQEGVALAPGLGVKSVRGALKKNLRWVGREPGSGARACLEELLESRPQPRRVARDHRGVAEAIRCGWADAGVCVRLVSEEARLEFLSVRDETYDLCYPTASSGDARLKALIEVIRSDAYRRMLGELPGYNVAHAGEVEVVK